MQTMIKNISSLLVVVLAMLMLTSCLGNDDDDTTYYEDTAITSFSLGTLNKYVPTKARDGVTDSTYKTTFSAASYKFNIDQTAKAIYNTDSLPVGTDVAHVLATITTKNSGTAVLHLYNKNGQDSLIYYNSTDSIDFTDPVKIRVYNMTGTAFREYTINVNVHKQDSDAFNWNAMTSELLPNVIERKIVALGNRTYLFGNDGTHTLGYRKAGDTWVNLSTSLDADAYKHMTPFNGYIYTINENNLCRSTDGTNWSVVASAQGIKQLAGASTTKLYAITDNGIEWSNDGFNWTNDNLDDSADLLPAEDINMVCLTSEMNSNVNHLILIGNRESKTIIWSKVEENDNAASTEPWTYYNYDDYNRKTLPYLANLRVVAYNGGLLATGGDFTKVYTSPDNGLTWDTAATYDLPSSFTGTPSQFALACDNSNVLYISKAASNTVLYGRLAQLGWKTEQNVFK